MSDSPWWKQTEPDPERPPAEAATAVLSAPALPRHKTGRHKAGSISRLSRKKLISAGIAGVVLVAAGIATALAASGSPGGSSSTGNTSGVSALSPSGAAGGGNGIAATPATTAPGSTHGPGQAASGPAPTPHYPRPLKPSSDAAAVQSWNSGPGGTALKKVTADIGVVLQAHGAGAYPQMLQGCVALGHEVSTARALPPIPDAAMQKLYADALSAFKTGAASCVAAITQHPQGVEEVITNVNHVVLNQAISTLNTGVKELYLATGALRTQ
jgi:hypothetical protein